MDDQTYRRARLRAAELDTSISRLVRDYLKDIAREESEFERLVRKERNTRSLIDSFSASDTLSRDSLHETSD